jgi:hypothetical protein
VPKVITYPFEPKSITYLCAGQFWAVPLSGSRFGCERIHTLPAVRVLGLEPLERHRVAAPTDAPPILPAGAIIKRRCHLFDGYDVTRPGVQAEVREARSLSGGRR